MTSLLDEIREGGTPAAPDPAFPHAPEGWTRARALEAAAQEGLALGEEHWSALRALQEYFARHEPTGINLRELHDALDEKFHAAKAASGACTCSFRAGRWRRAAASRA
jgi:sulfur relay (sulfurtransferase) DsrC/TusE family protein